MKIFYVRCSTLAQNDARQQKMALDNGAEKIFVDKASGKNTNRPEFQKMMAFVREGDSITVESISRIARNTRDLLNMVDDLKNKGVTFISLKEKFDTSTPQGQFILTIFASLAELEYESIHQRQAEGIAVARAQGKYKGRKPMSIDKEKFDAMCREWHDGKRTAVSIQKAFNITATTFYRWTNRKESTNEENIIQR